MDIRSSSSSKLRALLRQLRPRFLEVLATPHFRNSKVAHQILKDMELLTKLHKQMVLETSQVPGNRRLEMGFRPAKEGQDKRKPKLAQPKGFAHTANKSGNSAQTPFGSLDKKEAVNRFCVDGSYIIGSSVSGWNFITFSGSKPVYYGVKKESFNGGKKGLEKC